MQVKCENVSLLDLCVSSSPSLQWHQLTCYATYEHCPQLFVFFRGWGTSTFGLKFQPGMFISHGFDIWNFLWLPSCCELGWAVPCGNLITERGWGCASNSMHHSLDATAEPNKALRFKPTRNQPLLETTTSRRPSCRTKAKCISDGFLCQCLAIPPFRCNWVVWIHFWQLPPVSVSWFVDVCGVHFLRFCIILYELASFSPCRKPLGCRSGKKDRCRVQGPGWQLKRVLCQNSSMCVAQVFVSCRAFICNKFITISCTIIQAWHTFWE